MNGSGKHDNQNTDDVQSAKHVTPNRVVLDGLLTNDKSLKL
jgi:hypothetical protein